MPRSSAATPDEYLAELDDERRAFVSELRDLVNASLPPGYEEQMGFGMITWVVPLSVEPDTYNLEVIAEAVAAVPLAEYVARARAARS